MGWAPVEELEEGGGVGVEVGGLKEGWAGLTGAGCGVGSCRGAGGGAT